MTKTCEHCGNEFVSKPTGSNHDGARYCSTACVGDSKRGKHKVGGELVSRYHRTKVNGRSELEHRVVMAKVLGRPLRPDEQVHHKDHNRYNNDPANLEVVTVRQHADRHTWRPVTKECVMCGAEFAPHKTKRARQQTCGSECKRALMSQRAREREARYRKDKAQ